MHELIAVFTTKPCICYTYSARGACSKNGTVSKKEQHKNPNKSNRSGGKVFDRARPPGGGPCRASGPSRNGTG
eukprot:4693816-Pyramimonas_sp.AAC.1